MPASRRTSSYAEFIAEQLSPLGEVSRGRFFSGTGFSANDNQFAFVIRDVLYFVVDDSTRPEYEKMGSSCFSYSTRKGRIRVRRYFEVPTEILEDQSSLLRFARRAMEAARKPTGKSGKSDV